MDSVADLCLQLSVVTYWHTGGVTLGSLVDARASRSPHLQDGAVILLCGVFGRPFVQLWALEMAQNSK